MSERAFDFQEISVINHMTLKTKHISIMNLTINIKIPK